jgi:hypothetical protein
VVFGRQSSGSVVECSVDLGDSVDTESRLEY